MNISKVSAIKWAALLAVILVQLVTVLLLTNVERFYVEKQQLLQDPEFVSGPVHWKQSGEGDVQHNGKSISIVNTEIAYHALYQTVPIERSGYYNISFDAAMHGVRGVAKGYGQAEVFLIYRNELGSTNGKGKRLYSASGSSQMTPYNQSVKLAGGIGSVDFAVRVNNAQGKFTVANPVFSRLQEFTFYKNVRLALVLLWGLIFVGLGWVALRALSRIQALMLVGVLGMIMVGALLPENVMNSFYAALQSIVPSSLISTVSQAIARLFGYSYLSGSNAEIAKTGHFVVFFAVGIVVGINFKKIGVVFSLASIAVFASLTEALQLLVSGRTTSINDFFVDFVAGLFGLCVGLAIYVFFGGKERVPVGLAMINQSRR